MCIPRRWMFFALAIASIVFLLVYIYETSGLRATATVATVLVSLQVIFPFAEWLSRFHRVEGPDGWKRLGPAPTALQMFGMPLSMTFIVSLTHWMGVFFFRERPDFSFIGLIAIYFEQPLLLTIIVAGMVYGLFTGWVRRLRWNETHVELRDLMFRTRIVAWSDIDHVQLGSFWVRNTVLLTNGTRISFPNFSGGHGLDQLHADALAKGVLILTMVTAPSGQRLPS